MALGTTISQLDAAVRAVCPIHGVSIGVLANKATWRFDAKPEATAPQLAAAQGVIDAFDADEAAEEARTAAAARASAKALVDADGTQLGRILRALAVAILDELNILRAQIVGIASVTIDPPSLADGAGSTVANITINGAAFGDAVDVIAPYSLQGLLVCGYVHAANTIGVRVQNETGGAMNLASGSWTVIVRRHAAMSPRTKQQVVNVIKAKVGADE